ncbi:MAG: CPBP family intramembrane metalloprotease [Chloroflexi bacterium]|nr:CPBP family intramembrane metalloprotease [Chloroflexota bacterium]
MMAWIKANKVAFFYIVACLLAWSIGGLMIARRFGLVDVPGWPHYLTGLGPAAAALLTAALTGDLRDLLARITRWRFGGVWWLVVLSPLLLFAVAAPIQWIITGEPPALAGLGNVEDIGQIGVVGAALLWLATFGFGEETGWRGFAQHHLQQAHGARRTALIVGVLWIVWHLPYFFYQSTFMSFGVLGTVGWSIGLVAGAVVLAWLYNGTGQSILAVALWHALFNLASAAPGSEVVLAPAMSVAVIGAAIILRRVEANRTAEAPA